MFCNNDYCDFSFPVIKTPHVIQKLYQEIHGQNTAQIHKALIHNPPKWSSHLRRKLNDNFFLFLKYMINLQYQCPSFIHNIEEIHFLNCNSEDR